MLAVLPLIVVALALLPDGIPFGGAAASEVRLATEAGSRRAAARAQSVLPAERGEPAGVVLSVFDPKTSRYWSAGFVSATRDLTAEWGEQTLSQMKFAAGPDGEIVGLRVVQSHVQIRASSAHAVSLDAGHAEAVRAFSRAGVGEGWRTVAFDPAFAVCAGSGKTPATPLVALSIIDVRHENRRWYLTVKNVCGKRRVVTLSESFELLD